MPDQLLFWNVITHVGGVFLMLTVAGALGLYLLAAGARRAALEWGVLFCGGMAVVVATKIAFVGWGIGSRALDFAGLSGHAMRAAAVLPLLFYLLAGTRTRAWRITGALAGAALAVLVAISRVVLHSHSVSEAVGGCVFGLLLAWLLLARLPHPLLRTEVRALLAVCVLLVTPAPAPIASGEAGLTQRWITTVALTLSGHTRPFERADWARPDGAR